MSLSPLVGSLAHYPGWVEINLSDPSSAWIGDPSGKVAGVCCCFESAGSFGRFTERKGREHRLLRLEKVKLNVLQLCPS